MIDYGNTFARIDKLRKNFENLIECNRKLVEANKKLRQEIETNLELYKANLRVQKVPPKE